MVERGFIMVLNWFYGGTEDFVVFCSGFDDGFFF